MEGGERPERSGHCLRDAHGRCPHLAGIEPVRLWRPRPRAEWSYLVCLCDCHAGCPLTGRRAVSRDVWGPLCTCPGAAPFLAREQRADEQRRAVTAVYAEAKQEGQRDAAQIERRLRAVFTERGEDPPPGLAVASRAAAAANAPRGTRRARLLWLSARGVADTVRWAWRPLDGRADPAWVRARSFYATVGAAVAIATSLTVVAARSSGRRRLATGAVATSTWLAASTSLAVGTFVVRTARSAEEQPPTPPADRHPDDT